MALNEHLTREQHVGGIAVSAGVEPSCAASDAARDRFSIVDLFSGAGGLSEGFRQAGFDVLAGSDNDPDALATFARNFQEADAILGDIRRPDIKERILDVAGRASVLVGGPP